MRAAQWHVSTSGNDQGAGNQSAPFATVKKGLSSLKPGDTLFLHGGIYREAGLNISLAGSASARTLIASYGNERAEICGSFGDFETAPNTQWELVDAQKQIYRSKKSFTQSWTSAWLLKEGIMLPHYETYESFTATSCNCQAGACYAGPGVFLRNGKLEIRLQHDPNDLVSGDGSAIAPLPADPNPNNNAIRVDFDRLTMYINGASYVTIRNVDFHQGDWRTVEVAGSSHHVEFDGCTIRARSYGLLCRPETRDLEIHHCTFDNGLGDWFRWGDVKNGCAPLEGYNNFMVSLGGQGHYVHHNTWKNCFINISIGERNIRVTDNLFIRPHETFHIPPNSDNIEIARNVIRHGMEAFARVPRDWNYTSDTYIHHNIVDLTAARRVERQGNMGEFNRVWTYGWSVWGSHGCDERCDVSNWKIYNNTFLYRYSSQRSWGRKHCEYNNIFFLPGTAAFNSFAGADAAGNVVWRTGGATSLAEPAGLAIDPKFDTAACMAQRYDQPSLDSIRKLYMPREEKMFTSGKSYAAVAWPGTQDVNYRGALGRGHATGAARSGRALAVMPVRTSERVLLYTLQGRPVRQGQASGVFAVFEDNRGFVDSKQVLRCGGPWSR